MCDQQYYPAITQENLKDPAFVARLQEWARRDNCVDVILPSDIRLLVGAIADHVISEKITIPFAEKITISVKDPNEEPTQRNVSTTGTQDTFQKELERLINIHSKENGSNTPDFILAQYLVSCLEVFNKTIHQRNSWYKE